MRTDERGGSHYCQSGHLLLASSCPTVWCFTYLKTLNITICLLIDCTTSPETPRASCPWYLYSLLVVLHCLNSFRYDSAQWSHFQTILDLTSNISNEESSAFKSSRIWCMIKWHQSHWKCRQWYWKTQNLWYLFTYYNKVVVKALRNVGDQIFFR